MVLKKSASDILISILIVSWFLMIYGFAFAVKKEVGHWPYYSHPDPKNINSFMQPLIYFVYYAFVCLIFSKAMSLVFENIKIGKSFFIIFLLSLFIWYFIPSLSFAVLIFGGYSLLVSIPVIVYHAFRKNMNWHNFLSLSLALVFVLHFYFDPFQVMDWFLD